MTKTPRTTVENLASRMTRIHLQELSQLYRDAIQVTRRLCLQYLWIDSLCIVQNDEADWQREASRMGDVFSNAEITISAAISEDGQSSIFSRRDTSMVQTPFRKRAGDSPQGSFYLRKQRDPRDEIDNCALNKRAWVLQERILSPRVLTFSSHQVLWECREMGQTDKGPKLKLFPNSPRGLLQSLLHFSKRPGDLEIDMPTYDCWRSIVSNASCAKLTYEKDRLYAIEGLAERVRRVMGSEYRYGTFMSISDLATQLSWTRVSSVSSYRLPVPRRAPSWSWAALEGDDGVRMPDAAGRPCVQRLPTSILTILAKQLPRAGALCLSAHFQTCEVIKGRRVEWSYGAPTLLPIDPRRDEEELDRCQVLPFRGYEIFPLAPSSDPVGIYGAATFDMLPNEFVTRSYTCLLLSKKNFQFSQENSARGTALLLRAVEGEKDTFVRVGIVTLFKRGLEDLLRIPRQTVTLW
jgi:hypothetical protein